MVKLELSQWDLLTLEVALRKLQASGEVDRVSLGFLMAKLQADLIEQEQANRDEDEDLDWIQDQD